MSASIGTKSNIKRGCVSWDYWQNINVASCRWANCNCSTCANCCAWTSWAVPISCLNVASKSRAAIRIQRDVACAESSAAIAFNRGNNIGCSIATFVCGKYIGPRSAWIAAGINTRVSDRNSVVTSTTVSVIGINASNNSGITTSVYVNFAASESCAAIAFN